MVSQIKWEKMSFKEKMVLVHELVIEKIKLDQFLIPKPRINSKQIRGLKVKSEAILVLEREKKHG